jgi:hypothetical protein
LVICGGTNGQRGLDILLLRRTPRLVPSSLVQLREGIAEPISKIGGAAVLEYRILHDCRPDGAILLVSRLQRTILLFGERSTLLASSFLEEGRAIREGRPDLVG